MKANIASNGVNSYLPSIVVIFVDNYLKVCVKSTKMTNVPHAFPIAVATPRSKFCEIYQCGSLTSISDCIETTNNDLSLATVEEMLTNYIPGLR